jgi:hypothetical protein
VPLGEQKTLVGARFIVEGAVLIRTQTDQRVGDGGFARAVIAKNQGDAPAILGLSGMAGF